MPIILDPALPCAPKPDDCAPAAPTAPNALADAILQNALGPASASGDGQSVTQHSIPDQIAADRYAASKRAAAHPFGGIRRVRIRGNSAL